MGSGRKSGSNWEYHYFLFVNYIICTRVIPKSTSDWLVKKIQNREQKFIIWNSYVHTYITALLLHIAAIHI